MLKQEFWFRIYSQKNTLNVREVFESRPDDSNGNMTKLKRDSDDNAIEDEDDYQTEHRSVGFILLPFGQEYTSANSGRFDKTTFVRANSETFCEIL